MGYLGLSGTDCSSRIKPTVRASAADLDCYAAKMVQATSNASASVRAQWMGVVNPADRAAFYVLLAKHKMRSDRIDELKAKFPVTGFPPAGVASTGGGLFSGRTAGILASILKPGVPAGAPAAGPAGGGGFVPSTSWLPGAAAASPGAAPISASPLGPDGGPGPSAGAQAMLRSAASDLRARGVVMAPAPPSGPLAFLGGGSKLPIVLAIGGAALVGVYLMTRKKKKH